MSEASEYTYQWTVWVDADTTDTAMQYVGYVYADDGEHAMDEAGKRYDDPLVSILPLWWQPPQCVFLGPPVSEERAGALWALAGWLERLGSKSK